MSYFIFLQMKGFHHYIPLKYLSIIIRNNYLHALISYMFVYHFKCQYLNDASYKLQAYDVHSKKLL